MALTEDERLLAEIDRDLPLIRKAGADDLVDEVEDRRDAIKMVPESHPDRDESIRELHKLVSTTVDRALAPALELAEDLAFEQLEQWRNGDLAIAPGDAKF